MAKTIGYKAMSLDMVDKGIKFEVGKTYRVGKDSDSGFLFCEEFENVFDYYDWNDCRVFMVEATGPVVSDGQTSITKEITILSELTRADLDEDEEEVEMKSYEARNYYRIMLEPDEELIFNNFNNSFLIDVRLAVVNRLTSDELLLTFKDDEYRGVREAVVNRMRDEDLIYKTFKDDTHSYVRAAVVKAISDEQLIYDTFANDTSWLVRYTIVNKLTDKELLSSFVNDLDSEIRETVLKKINS